MKYYIIVASKDHFLKGEKEGFAQSGYEKKVAIGQNGKRRLGHLLLLQGQIRKRKALNVIELLSPYLLKRINV